MTYPLTPGHARNSKTSRNAAKNMAPKVRLLHHIILQTMLQHGSLNADECAERMPGKPHFMRIRPRFTELMKEEWGNLLERTGEERPSALGNPMDVARLTEAGKDVAKRGADVIHARTVTPATPESPANSDASFGPLFDRSA